jgi:uncharacterized alpha-E superfamily protein
VHYQTSLLPQSAGRAEQGWRGVLGISELTQDFMQRYSEVDERNVMDFMVRDESNLSSISACLRAARENARAVRGALTTEVWETQNQTWLEFKRMLAQGSFRKDPSEFFEWVKFRSHLSRGVTLGTMLQDEALHFLRIGTFLERADNTARLLDVKFHAITREQHDVQAQTQSMGGMTQMQGMDAGAPTQGMNGMSQVQGANGMPQVQGVNGITQAQATGSDQPEYDFYHWSAILRSVSAFEVYRKVYRNVIRPERVAELLILRADMPRSLAACMDEVVTNLRLVANEQSRETLRRGERLRADVLYGRIDEILDTGLHAYLTHFLDRVSDLGVGISRDFLVPVA